MVEMDSCWRYQAATRGKVQCQCTKPLKKTRSQGKPLHNKHEASVNSICITEVLGHRRAAPQVASWIHQQWTINTILWFNKNIWSSLKKFPINSTIWRQLDASLITFLISFPHNSLNSVKHIAMTSSFVRPPAIAGSVRKCLTSVGKIGTYWFWDKTSYIELSID